MDNVVKNLPIACSSEIAAVEFLEAQRWGDSPICPHCESSAVYQMKDRKGDRNKRFLWKCNACERQYTVRIGTVFEDSRIPLRHWCYGFWAACASKKGVSALQISRMTDISYKSALFMMHRIRFAMADEAGTPEQLTGTVEVDETYVGGKPRYVGKHNFMTRPDRKAAVVAMVERGGQVRVSTMPRVNSKNLRKMVAEHIHESAHVVTDEARYYDFLGRERDGGHSRVNHRRKEYVRGEVYTNTIESFFAILKRGINGTFHAVSKKHLHRYLAEFQHRYNTRKLSDGQRVVATIKKAQGKRLMYKDPI